MEHTLTLRKAEKLRHKSFIDPLFGKGSARTAYEFPLRLTWRAVSEDEAAAMFRNGVPSGVAPLQMMITVPKKKRRHAVDRVLMRRRIREAYRLQRGFLFPVVDSYPGLRTVSMAFIYMADRNVDYAVIEKKMAALLQKVGKGLASVTFSPGPDADKDSV